MLLTDKMTIVILASAIIILSITVYFVICEAWKYIFRGSRHFNLKEHRIFKTIEFHIEENIPCVNVGSLEKNKLFQFMLKAKYKAVYDLSKRMVFDIGSKKFQNDEDFFKWNVRWILEMVATYEKEWRANGVSDKMIDTFNEWHSHRVEVLLYEIESVSRSQAHGRYQEKLAMIFDLIKYVLDMTIYDVERSLLKLDAILGFTYKMEKKENNGNGK